MYKWLSCHVAFMCVRRRWHSSEWCSITDLVCQLYQTITWSLHNNWNLLKTPSIISKCASSFFISVVQHYINITTQCVQCMVGFCYGGCVLLRTLLDKKKGLLTSINPYWRKPERCFMTSLTEWILHSVCCRTCNHWTRLTRKKSKSWCSKSAVILITPSPNWSKQLWYVYHHNIICDGYRHMQDAVNTPSPKLPTEQQVHNWSYSLLHHCKLM